MISVTRTSRRILLGSTAAAIWLAVGATFFQTVRLTAKKAPTTVILSAKPSAVRIQVDRKQLFDGNYQKTPVNISLPPGRHNIKISRDGFINHNITVESSSGGKIPLDHVLEQDPRVELGLLHIEHRAGEDPIQVEMENGIVSAKTPLTIDSLVVGKDYILNVYPDWPDKRNAGHCRVKITAGEDGTEVELRRLKSGNVRFDGCRPLRKLRK